MSDGGLCVGVARVLIALVVAGATVALGAALAGPAGAHTPHDTISDADLSPSFATDDTLFVAARGRLLRSTDGGASWTHVVRGLGGEKVHSLDIAPSNTNIVYLATSTTGIHRSVDNGLTWVLVNQGLPSFMREPVVSPTDADVVLARGLISGLYRTTDGGQNWTALPGFGPTSATEFVEGGSGRIVAGDSNGIVHLSVDGGDTWTQPLSIPGTTITAIGSAPTTPTATVWVATDDGQLYRSTDAGDSFAAIGSGLPAQTIDSIVASTDYTVDTTLWTSAAADGAYRSSDGGITWTRQDTGLTTDPQADQLGEPQFLGLSVASDATGDPVLALSGFDGLFRSDDQAASWQPIETLTEYPVGLAVSPDFANDQTVALTTYVKGAYVSDDAGTSWDGGHVGLGHEIDGGNEFLPLRRLYNVVFSPNVALDDTIFSSTGSGLLRSTNRGYSWEEIGVASPPSARGRYVIAPSPDFASDQTLFVGGKDGAIHRSTQGGDAGSWIQLSSVGQQVRSVAVSPAFTVDQELYVGTTAGAFKSTDGGSTWTTMTPPGTTMVVLSPDFANDGTVYVGTHGLGLWRSPDRGQTWALITGGPLAVTSRIEAVAVSPDYANDQTVLASVANVGLVRSTDGGLTFVPAGPGLYASNIVIADFNKLTSIPIQFSPDYANDQTIFAYGQQAVVRSNDGGDTWQTLPVPAASELLNPPVVAAAPVNNAVAEGDDPSTVTLRIAFDLSHPSIDPVTVDWSTLDVPGNPNIATSTSGDFVAASGTLSFAQGDTRKYLDITVLGDRLDELDEALVAQISNPTNATVGGFGGLGLGFITDDDDPPAIVPGVGSVTEGDVGTSILSIPVTLSAPSGLPVTVDWTSIDFQATQGEDFAAASGTLTFDPGQTADTIDLTVFGDTDIEPDETAVVLTSNATNATIGGFFGVGAGNILTDD